VEVESDDEPSARVIESDSRRASPREEMPKEEAQDGTDTWNT
jgi:hypothetical protein